MIPVKDEISSIVVALLDVYFFATLLVLAATYLDAMRDGPIRLVSICQLISRANASLSRRLGGNGYVEWLLDLG